MFSKVSHILLGLALITNAASAQAAGFSGSAEPIQSLTIYRMESGNRVTKTYKTSDAALKAYLLPDGSSLILSESEGHSMCGQLVGRLVDDLKITVADDNDRVPSGKQVILVPKDSRVFGLCQSSDELTNIDFYSDAEIKILN